MNNQVAFSFDTKTREKILKSAWISLFAPTIVFFLERLGDIHFHSENPAFDYVLVWMVPILINALIEFIKGTSQKQSETTQDAG